MQKNEKPHSESPHTLQGLIGWAFSTRVIVRQRTVGAVAGCVAARGHLAGPARLLARSGIEARECYASARYSHRSAEFLVPFAGVMSMRVNAKSAQVRPPLDTG